MISLEQLVNSLSEGYMTAQALTIFMLFAAGFLFVRAVWDISEEDVIWELLYSFPAGLAVFSVSAYLMLCLGIPYNTYTAAASLAGVSMVCYIIYSRKRRAGNIKIDKMQNIAVFTGIAAALALSFMLTSNFFRVALDNDSFFYFSAYPEAIVREGRYIRYFDVFLTDAAPVGSIIQTIPYLFGFSETFGIQYFLDADFLLIFSYALYTELKKSLEGREAAAVTLAVSVFLLTSSAYLTTAKWVMAGVYFMSTYFFCVYLGFRAESMERRPYGLMALFAVQTAMMRHEGVAFIVMAVLTLSFLKGYRGKELVLCYICPVTVAAALYYIRVFVILKVFPLYAFLTPVKAVLMLLSLVLSGLYLLFVRDRLGERVRSQLPLLLPLLLLILNMGLMAFLSREYLGNLKMFYLNVRIGAGWGWFGYIAGVVFICLVIKAFVNKERYLLFFDSLMISYVLCVLLVAFGRGDELRKGIGDSGNRVMLTAVPLIVFAMTLRWFTGGADPREGAGEPAEAAEISMEGEDNEKS